jgi:hypothetical protein
MKKIIIMLLVLSVFSWISVVSADNFPAKESPESMLTCHGGGISSHSVPGNINTEQCIPYGDSHCALCITSLEGQGCKIVDVVLTHVPVEGGGEVVIWPMATYFLSCNER